MRRPIFASMFLAVAGCWGFSESACLAADPASDWQHVTELDAGPKSRPTTQQEARKTSAEHMARQEAALRSFLAAHPADPHAFEARLRLSRLLQIRAGMENAETLRAEARRLLEELGKSATAEQKVEVDFARITFQMRGLRIPSQKEREELLRDTRRFQAEHAQDRRVPRLLAEVARIFDAEPETKRSLLTAAQSATEDPELKSQIADDLKRIELLGKPVPLHFTTMSGKPVDLEESGGKVVILIFFADWSPPSMEALGKVQRAVQELPKESVQALGFSLDSKPEDLAAILSKNAVAWPVGFDGKGWASPIVRSLGVNTLPTVWIIDQRGMLRALNGLESTVSQVTQLLRKPPAPM